MQNFLEKPVFNILKKVDFKDILTISIITLTILSRFIGLGDRVMSHDEVNHVVPAFDLFSGRGYRHDPVTHGPLQFHFMALSYFLFGDNDFTSRLPHALFSILTVSFVLIYLRRYLGKLGSIIAGILFAISPFMLFYGRYARNDIICVFLGIVALYEILRYFETKDIKYLYFFSAAIALNFTAKETAYILSAQLLIFFFILFIRDLIISKWADNEIKNRILLTNIILILLIIVATTLSVLLFRSSYKNIQGVNTIPILEDQQPTIIKSITTLIGPLLIFSIPGLTPLIIVTFIIVILRKHLQWDLLEDSRSFSFLVLLGTLVLPLLAPFLVRFAGMDPASYSDSYVLLTNYIYIGFFFVIAYIFGSSWNHKHWWKLAFCFYSIYIVFYSTFFTNNVGILTGMVGSLGHWLNQQSVQRGGQPIYYYAFILIPIYEFLAAFGSIAAFFVGIKQRSFWTTNSDFYDLTNPSEATKKIESVSKLKRVEKVITLPDQNLIPTPAIFIYLVLTSLIAYTIAGEKMPWLALHIIFPMLITASWAFGRIITRFQAIFNRNEKNFYLSIFFLLINSLVLIVSLIGNKSPFQGKTTFELQYTYSFLLYLIIEIGLIIFIIKSSFGEKLRKLTYSFFLGLCLLMALMTVRTSYRASYINFDYPKEFLVYAHAADGPKMIMEQVEEISRRTTTGLDIEVAYDNHGLYPFWWYMRHYPNKNVYLENPTRTLENTPLIIAGQDKYAKLDPIVRDNYTAFEYMRLWWPMQDYWNLNWERISSALTSSDMRQALFNIWFDRDYSLYAQINENQHLTLETWLPSEKMRLYIRKDIASQMWQYNTQASISATVESDPYEELMVSRIPDGFISMSGSNPGDLNAPRGIDIAQDGSIYVADSLNHRIQQFSTDGLLLNVWGSFANTLEENAPGGTFNEPWDIAVGKDGSVYVADTFNHRIQMFDSTGRFIKMWGTFAQGDSPDSFWGPRGITIDSIGNVLVTDTGNKRVVVFDSNLNYLTQFGGGGFDAGQFDEPVGITVNSSGEAIVADTWNRRVQIFKLDEVGNGYIPVNSFDVSAWYGQGIDNKPFITTDKDGNIFLSDPETGRILVFSATGEYIKGYQDINISEDLIGYPYGLGFDQDGNLWFCDASANVISYINEP